MNLGKALISLGVGVGIGLLVSVAVLPTTLAGWYNATQSGGALYTMASASPAFGTLWNFVPTGVVIAFVAIIVAYAMNAFGD